VTDTRDVFPDAMPDIPLDDLPEPLVPGGFWEPESDITLAPAPPEPDYESMVRSALMATLAVLVGKVAWVLLIANFIGVPIGIRFWLGFVPYFALELQQAHTFTTIITVSGIGMAFVAVVLMAWPLIRPGWSRLQIWGRAVALAVTLETWLLEVLRHVLDPPILRWDLAWITVVEVAAGAALVFLSLKQPGLLADTTRQSAERLPSEAPTEDTP
jgi:hypothetical protein